jgi:hypothetical protein
MSRLIRFFSGRAEWSHTANGISVWGQDRIIEMQRKGIQEYSYEKWQDIWGYEYQEYFPPVGYDQKEAARRLITATEIQVKYDLKRLFIKVPVWLLTGKYKENISGRFTCDELTVWAFGLPKHLRTPQMVADYLEANWVKR